MTAVVRVRSAGTASRRASFAGPLPFGFLSGVGVPSSVDSCAPTSGAKRTALSSGDVLHHRCGRAPAAEGAGRAPLAGNFPIRPLASNRVGKKAAAQTKAVASASSRE